MWKNNVANFNFFAVYVIIPLPSRTNNIHAAGPVFMKFGDKILRNLGSIVRYVSGQGPSPSTLQQKNKNKKYIYSVYIYILSENEKHRLKN